MTDLPPVPPRPPEGPAHAVASSGKPNVWRRFRGLPRGAQIAAWVVLAVVIIAAAAAGGGGKKDVSVSAGSASSSSSENSSSSPSSTSTTTTSTTTTTTTIPTTTTLPPDQVLSGRGDSIVDIAKPDGPDEPAMAHVVGNGTGNFVVKAENAAGDDVDLLVNTIGKFNGIVALDFVDGGPTTQLEVKATGPWTITVQSVRKAFAFEGTTAATGHGDSVILYAGDATKAAITNQGDSNFVVRQYVGSDANLLVNEIGPYQGTVRLDAGFLVITSNGNWSIKPQA